MREEGKWGGGEGKWRASDVMCFYDEDNQDLWMPLPTHVTFATLNK